MIKLIAFDLDGTTVTEHRYLSEGNREALIKAGEKGVILLPCTGRMKSFLPEIITSLPGVRYAITSNGGAVYDLKEDKPLVQRLISNAKAMQIHELLTPYGTYIEYYEDGKAYTRRGDPERAFTDFGMPESKRPFIDGKPYILVDDLKVFLRESGICPEKINLPYMAPELRRQIWADLETLEGLRLTSSMPDNIEINDSQAHKGSALLSFAEQMGILPEEVMAIGDNSNDLTMLKAACCSVAVGDGSAEAKAAAKYVTAPHDEDGLARAIERFVL